MMAAMDDSAGRSGLTGSGQALRRVLNAADRTDLLGSLADRLSGADLTTLLLEVFRRRAERLVPAEVRRRYRSDRFVAPATVDFVALRRAEDAMLGALPPEFEVLTLAPVLPLGSHWVMGRVDPRNVVATIRGTEVAADPTSGLALEAAERRGNVLRESPRSADPVRLAASQRVTRAQLFDGPTSVPRVSTAGGSGGSSSRVSTAGGSGGSSPRVSFAHFQLLGVVTAGRDTGNSEFEIRHLAEHARMAAAGAAAAGAEQVTIAVTCLDETARRAFADVKDALGAMMFTDVVEAPERESGRAYYRGLCFKVFAAAGGQRLEVGDGGFVDWTAKLLGNRKERLLISGYGIDRLALLGAGQPR
jgi:hypothetical protein